MNAMLAQPGELFGSLGADFMHERSREPDALPLILICGGWGRSAEVIGPLTNPRAHGGDPADAFHVVVPLLPDLAGSPRARHSGWERYRLANAWAWLMQGLAYDRYGAYGNDFGAYVSRDVGRVERGARFAANDAPAHLVADARAFFRRFR